MAVVLAALRFKDPVLENKGSSRALQKA